MQDDIIRMALESGLGSVSDRLGFVMFNTAGANELQRFAALVAAHEREKQAKLMILNGKSVVEQVHSYVSRNDTDFTSESMAKMVCDFIAAEREACAKVCEELRSGYTTLQADIAATQCAAAIRARGM